ncbi:MAG: diphthine--ammonia ligase [Candidatus Bathyarchaeota archaeon]|nr:MAG: diphthine--ammonia ligase [Candidatus Bathyarchaeota archaeon]
MSRKNIVQKRAAALYSGGKDSNLALWQATRIGIKVECLLSIIPEMEESWMFHFPNAEWTALQAKGMEIPSVQVTVSSLGEREMKELDTAISNLQRSLDIDALISGVVESSYQKSRLAQICERYGLELITPLWKKDSTELISEMLRLNFDIRFVKVSAMGLGEEWLGRKLDREAFTELALLSRKYGFHLAGEGGEYETFVCDSPLFKKRIKITRTTKSWSQDSGILYIKKAELVEKRIS